MTPPDDTQRTIGGLAGKAVGKAKEASRAAREREARGAVQERGAEVPAERDRLADQVAAEHRPDAHAADERAPADGQRQSK